MNIYQAAKILGITKRRLAADLNVSTSTLYRRQVKECGKGVVDAPLGDPYTIDMFSGVSQQQVAKHVLQAHGLTL